MNRGEGRRPAVLVFLLVAAVVAALWLRAHAAAPPGTAFVGTFYYVDDFYNYLSHVEQAARGEILFRSKLAPPELPAVLVNLEWLAVGWLSAVLGQRAVLAYRLAGLAALLALVFLAHRWLARCGLSTAQRLAGLLLVFTGGGVGGVLLALGLLPGTRAFDVRTGAFPFVEAIANPHFLIGTALLLAALSAWAAGRPWLGAALGTVLGLARPYDAALLAGIEGLHALLAAPVREWPRRLAPVLALAPVLGYSAWLFTAAPGFGAFSSARYAALGPSLPDLLIALGPALALALTAAGAWREAGPDARTDMLRLALWAALALGLVATRPVSFSLQFVVGIGVPLLALAAIGLARLGTRALAAAVPLMATSSAVVVWLCASPAPGRHVPLERLRVADALRQACAPGDLLLAPADIGLYAGGLAPCWPYVSHAAATDHDARASRVERFYDPATPPSRRAALLEADCPRHVVLPLAVPAGWLGEDAPYAPALAVGQPPRGLAVWTRAASAPCR